ncbi:MAG: Gfo/Idh/MocA family oxidoreductase [Candidatus Poribacteria bacterium]
MSDSPARVGIIGCGTISGTYLRNAPNFPSYDIVAVSDLRVDAAQARAEEFGIAKACTPDELLADDDIDIVINIRPHSAHGAVGIAALEAGKSVYIEKPMAVSLDDAKRMMELSAETGLRVGAAPDTFFGGTWQTARALIDEGAIGEPIGGFSCIQSRSAGPWLEGDTEEEAKAREGYQSFYATNFFEFGVTWLFDRGPYYLHALVNLLGPVARVTGSARNTWTERNRGGSKFPCDTPTNFAGVLDFANGAVLSFINSADIVGMGLPHVEIYGSEGSLRCIDPNDFGGTLYLRKPGRGEEAEPIEPRFPNTSNMRGIGLADMVTSMRADRPHRASGEMGLHTVEICHALHDASAQNRHISLETTCAQPAALPAGLSDWEVDA